MSKYRQHQILVRELCISIQKEYPLALIFQPSVGLFFTKSGRPIKIGKNGQSDIYLLHPHSAMKLLFYVAIEVKTGNSQLSPVQKNFKREVESRGGTYILARSVEQTLEELKNVI
ncbi:MAG: hypothetical protein DRQ88_09250 [Epsilonproteobacteria bacterium]|nr:MAG: hypothetical protein DRQ88_09250 [Campylobacterota bacterium]